MKNKSKMKLNKSSYVSVFKKTNNLKSIRFQQNQQQSISIQLNNVFKYI